MSLPPRGYPRPPMRHPSHVVPAIHPSPQPRPNSPVPMAMGHPRPMQHFMPPPPPPPPPPSHSSPFPLHPSSALMAPPPTMTPPPTFVSRASWEEGLGELLKNEPNSRALSVGKYGLRMEVPVVGKTTPQTATATTPTAASASADEMVPRKQQQQQQQQQQLEGVQDWNSDPAAALDLGVVTIVGSEEVEEKAYTPKGYEGAPAVVLSMHKHVLGEDEDQEEDNGEGMLDGRWQPSCVSRPVRIVNEAPGPYLLREVLILPRDERDATLWVEVEMGGWTYSSKAGHVPFLVRKSSGVESPTRRSMATEPASAVDNLLLGGITVGRISVFATHEAESSTVKKWVLLRVEGPGVGPAHDLHYHSFVVARKVVATVVDASAHSLLNVEARPFVPQALKQYFDEPCNVIFAHPLKPPPFQPRGMASVLQVLPPYFLSESLKRTSIAFKSSPAGQRGDPYVWFQIIKTPKTVEDHCGNMRAMLSLEEAQAAEDIRRYDLFGVPIIYRERPVGQLDAPLVTTITVPGASEKRPPLAYGDEVRLRPALPPSLGLGLVGGGRSRMEIRAAVLETKEERVKLLLPSNFPTETFPSESRFHVRFCYDRFGYRFLHRALQHFTSSAGTGGGGKASAGHFLFPCADGEKKGGGDGMGGSVDQ